MNYKKRFSCRFLTIASAVAIAFIQSQATLALPTKDINSIAEKVTVLINAKDPEQGGEIVENGSGTIVAKEGKTYYVLTANHVVCEIIDREACRSRYSYQLVTANGEQYFLNNSKIKKLPGVDLAIVQFTSQENYPVATLAHYPLATDDQFVYASGWVAPNRYIPRHERLFSIGKIIPKDLMPLFRIFSPSLGYNL